MFSTTTPKRKMCVPLFVRVGTSSRVMISISSAYLKSSSSHSTLWHKLWPNLRRLSHSIQLNLTANRSIITQTIVLVDPPPSRKVAVSLKHNSMSASSLPISSRTRKFSQMSTLMKKRLVGIVQLWIATNESIPSLTTCTSMCRRLRNQTHKLRYAHHLPHLTKTLQIVKPIRLTACSANTMAGLLLTISILGKKHLRHSKTRTQHSATAWSRHGWRSLLTTPSISPDTNNLLLTYPTSLLLISHSS